jgi:hypothetical protein
MASPTEDRNHSNNEGVFLIDLPGLEGSLSTMNSLLRSQNHPSYAIGQLGNIAEARTIIVPALTIPSSCDLSTLFMQIITLLQHCIKNKDSKVTSIIILTSMSEGPNANHKMRSKIILVVVQFGD